MTNRLWQFINGSFTFTRVGVNSTAASRRFVYEAIFSGTIKAKGGASASRFANRIVSMAVPFR